MTSRTILAAALAAITGLAACSDSGSVPEGDAANHIADRRFGAQAAPQVMLTEGRPAWVQQAVAGWRPIDEADDLPASVETLRIARSCSLRRPAKGERVANVHVTSGLRGSKTPIYAFAKKDVMDRAKAWINVARMGERRLSAERPIASSLGPVDVIVTDTSAPLYLVLQGGGFSRMWNIHAAPGVRIAHVAVVGGRYVGVANVPDGATVEFMADKKATKCGALPFLKPNERWDAVVRAKGGDSLMKEAVEKRTAKYRKYSRWFKHNFGTSASHKLIGDDVVDHALVGPLPASPDQRVPYAPLKNARVLVSPADYLLVETPREFRSKSDAITMQAAEKALGTTLESVRKAAQ